MRDEGGKKSERSAKELNLRPFAARDNPSVQEIDPSRPIGEIFGEEPAKEEEYGEHGGNRENGKDGKKEERGKGRRNTGKVYAPAKRKEKTVEYNPLSAQGPESGYVLENRRKRRERSLTEREKLAIERQRRLNRFISKCIVAVILIAALLLTWFLLIVDEIDVSGNARFTQEEILNKSELKTGRHIWLENISDAKKRIEEDPYIENADIRRVYPDKLMITVTERTEAAVIVGLNSQAVIDPNGYVLSIGTRADYTGLIKISGMGFSGYHVGQRLGEESDFNSRTLVALLAAIYNAQIEGDIDTMDISNPLSIYMTTQNGLSLHIGQPDNLDDKLANYKIVLPKLRELGLDTSGTLDLSAMGDPVYSSHENMDLPAGTNSADPEDTAEPGGASPSPSPDVSPSPDISPSPSLTPAGGEDSFSG